MRVSPPPASRVLLVSLLLALAASGADAQLLDVPSFLALERTVERKFSSYDVAPGADSSMLVLADTWTRDIEKSNTIVQGFSPTGAVVGGMIRVDEDDFPISTRLMSDTRGGFLFTWVRASGYGLPFAARLLGPSGAPLGSSFTVGAGLAYASDAAPLPSGAVFVWNDGRSLQVRLYDPAGQSRGDAFVILSCDWFAVYTPYVAATSDGGFVIVWWRAGTIYGQLFDANGSPETGVLNLAGEFEPTAVAASPLGGFAVIGRRRFDTHRFGPGVWARRFDALGTPLGPSFPVDLLDSTVLVWPRGAFDAAGRLYVVWGADGATTAVPGARLYDAAGRTLQTPFRAFDVSTSEPSLALRPDGRFIEGWRSGLDLALQVRALCVPPDHTGCGDGVVSAPCERCDAGAANDDATPDACRTTCMLPSCGDGVVDHFEQCDDGNRIGCDGCDRDCKTEPGYVCGDGVVSADCDEQCDDGPANDDVTPNACRTDCQRAHCGDGVLDDGEGCDDGNRTSCDGCSDLCVPEPGLVCGDGIPEVMCGEQCDDGNAIVGDGCSEPCRLERIPGGGSPATDCQAEWVVDNPANTPRFDKEGAISGVQACRDGDSRCDFDTAFGTCTFHVRVCANNTDLSSCDPGSRLRSWELRAPSANKAAKRPELAAVRNAFATVPGAIIGPTRPDVCSDTLAVPVALRADASGIKAGTVVLKSFATLYSGVKDSDKLKLICMP